MQIRVAHKGMPLFTTYRCDLCDNPVDDDDAAQGYRLEFVSLEHGKALRKHDQWDDCHVHICKYCIDEIKRHEMSKDSGSMSASETLFEFCGWLTSRDQVTEMGASKDAALVADLVKSFCDKHKIAPPRHNWKNKI